MTTSTPPLPRRPRDRDRRPRDDRRPADGRTGHHRRVHRLVLLPRFDSPSVFGALLDDERGGHFRIRPAGTGVHGQADVLPDTAVLVTRFFTDGGVGQVVDFMPPAGDTATDNHRLVRLVQCVRGQMTFDDRRRRPGSTTAGTPHRIELTENGAVFTANGQRLTLHVVREPDDEHKAQVRVEDGDMHGTLDLVAGEMPRRRAGVRRRRAAAGDPGRRDPASCSTRRSASGGTGWPRRPTRGRWREIVNRSAITLKLMTYAPTGGIVAAPTAGAARAGRRRAQLGLPLHLGPRRLVLRARPAAARLHRGGRAVRLLAGRPGPGAASAATAARSTSCTASTAPPTSRRTTLDHWRGYRGSAPVRIGNGAAEQLQLDIYGEALDSIYAGDRAGMPLPYRGWTAISGVLDWLADNWDQPEEGIWETRGGRQAFTYGRVMCWVAFDRGHPAGRPSTGGPPPSSAGPAERDAIYQQVMERGFHARPAGVRPALQHRRPGLRRCCACRPSGFIDGRDPLWLSTLRRDGRRTGHRQPRLPLRPGGLPRRAARVGGHLLALHVRLRRRADPRRPAGRRPDRLREDADLRQPRRAVLRGDRPDRGADRQLPAGVHPPGADRRRGHPRRRAGRAGAGH